MVHPLHQRIMHVVLVKGPDDKKTFPDEKENAARYRAYALHELHGRCRISESDDTITVHAESWYRNKCAKFAGQGRVELAEKNVPLPPKEAP